MESWAVAARQAIAFRKAVHGPARLWPRPRTPMMPRPDCEGRDAKEKKRGVLITKLTARAERPKRRRGREYSATTSSGWDVWALRLESTEGGGEGGCMFVFVSYLYSFLTRFTFCLGNILSQGERCLGDGARGTAACVYGCSSAFRCVGLFAFSLGYHLHFLNSSWFMVIFFNALFA